MFKKYFFLLALIPFLSSCVKQEVGDLQVEYRMQLELPADANTLKTHIFEKRLASNWIQFLQQNNIDNTDIKAIKPRSVILSPIFDNGISYELISEAHAGIYPSLDPAEYLPIADIYDPLGDRDELVFLPGLADVKHIITQSEFMLRLSLNVEQIPGSYSEHYLTVQFDVFLNE